jgi:hypothetical protein
MGLARLLIFGRLSFNRKRNIHREPKILAPINREIGSIAQLGNLTKPAVNATHY